MGDQGQTQIARGNAYVAICPAIILLGFVVVAAMRTWPTARVEPQTNVPVVTPAVAPPTAEAARSEPPAVEETPEPARTTWRYQESTNSFTGEVFKSAELTSSNEFEFGFPYQGKQHGLLGYLPRPGRDGSFNVEFILVVEQGQFACGSKYCDVAVKFEDGHFEGWAFSLFRDEKPNRIYFMNYDPCITAKLAKSKSLWFEAPFYDEGKRVLKFEIAGLDALPLPKAKQPLPKKCLKS